MGGKIRQNAHRQSVLGLEVVLASGEVLDMCNLLVKNNAGYDLKQMFIGSEGTLGLITKIVLRLWSRPKGSCVSLIACESAGHLSQLFVIARAALGGGLSSFEAMWPEFYKLTVTQPGFGPPPLTFDHGVYAIIEVEAETDEVARAALTDLLEHAFESGNINDAIVSQSLSDRQSIWRTREDSDAIDAHYAAALSYDIGLKLADLGPFVQRLREQVAAKFPGKIPYIFGHVGDGNLHVMFGLTEDEAKCQKKYHDLLYGIVSEFPSSTISAEHGIGLEKRDYLDRSVSQPVLAQMRMLKRCYDPQNILNPNKIFIW